MTSEFLWDQSFIENRKPKETEWEQISMFYVLCLLQQLKRQLDALYASNGWGGSLFFFMFYGK
jgi:hypothetical protein